MGWKRIIKDIPVIGPAARRLYHALIKPPLPFRGSEAYWKERYERGGHSGDGSYDRLAEFKAEVLNAFVYDNTVKSVIEYGCGDGNQLALAKYPGYIGFDVSPDALSRCVERFSGDATKSFKLMGEYGGETAELSLSLDVIYHLVEDHVFVDYMHRLFDSSQRFVIIYSSDTDDNLGSMAAHVRHRRFSRWIAEHRAEWKLIRHIPNRYPSESYADFFVYARTSER